VVLPLLLGPVIGVLLGAALTDRVHR